ncbi:MAG: heme o synthase [Kiloniellales bacterium]|nr:heme o synthase [Kiloniellales bacterium]
MAVLAKNLWSLFKLRISLAIMLCALAGIAVASGPPLAGAQIAALSLAVLLSAASAGAFNHYVECDLDARMARTRGRPFVTGYFRRGPLWLGAILGLLAAAVMLAGFATNWAAAGYVFLGAFVYGVVYSVWLKRRTWLNIVLGGLSGSFAVLAGAAAVEPTLSPAAVILAAVLFLWTPPHFWSLATVLHRQYREAGVPMLPVVVGDRRAAQIGLAHTAALSLLALLPVAYGMGAIYLAGAVLGGGYFLWKSALLVREPGPAAAAANFRASLVQLTLLLLAAMADRWLAA